jgi:ATP-dependent Clp protease ATP-binding subunit ClpA
MAGFQKYLKTMLDQAETEARLDGSTTVEAHHLLLAIAVDQGSTPGRILASVRLDRDAIRAASDREFEHSLSAAGVSRSSFDGLHPATPDPKHVPHPGASVRLALERGVGSAAGADLQPVHLLLGILQAEVGTVPRALALAGIDRADLIARVSQTLN